MASKNEKKVLRSNMPLVRVVYKTLGGNNNYSFILCGAELADSSRKARIGGGGRRGGGETKRRGRKVVAAPLVRRLVSALWACILSFREHGRVNQPRDHRENNAVEILLSGNGSSFHRSNLPPSPLSPPFFFFFVFLLPPSSSSNSCRPSDENPSADRTWFISRYLVFAYKYIPDGNRNRFHQDSLHPSPSFSRLIKLASSSPSFLSLPIFFFLPSIEIDLKSCYIYQGYSLIKE